MKLDNKNDTIKNELCECNEKRVEEIRKKNCKNN